MADYSLVPVDYQPNFDGYSLVPVEHDPFAGDGVTQQAQAQPGQAAQVQAQPSPQAQQAQGQQAQPNTAPEPSDHGLSERQKLSPIEKALNPITSYPQTYDRMRNDALDLGAAGLNQIWHHDSLTDPQAHGLSDVLTGAAKAAIGGAGYVASPLTAAYRSIIGQPVEDVTGIPREYTEFAAQLATPGIGLARVPSSTPVVVGRSLPEAATLPGAGARAAQTLVPAAEETGAGLQTLTDAVPRSPASRAAKKGYSGIGTTPNGGPTFAGTAHLYPAGEGQQSVVPIRLTGSYRADEKLANEAGGFTEKPEGYMWHHVDDFNPQNGTSSVELVDKKVHNATRPHIGGVAQYEKHHGVRYKR